MQTIPDGPASQPLEAQVRALWQMVGDLKARLDDYDAAWAMISPPSRPAPEPKPARRLAVVR